MPSNDEPTILHMRCHFTGSGLLTVVTEINTHRERLLQCDPLTWGNITGSREVGKSVKEGGGGGAESDWWLDILANNVRSSNNVV